MRGKKCVCLCVCGSKESEGKEKGKKGKRMNEREVCVGSVEGKDGKKEKKK